MSDLSVGSGAPIRKIAVVLQVGLVEVDPNKPQDTPREIQQLVVFLPAVFQAATLNLDALVQDLADTLYQCEIKP